MSDNIKTYDADSTTQHLRTTDDGGVHTPHQNIDRLPLQHIDSFSRLRVSNPSYRFDSQLTYQIDNDLWDLDATGDGTIAHNATNRCATLTAGNTAGINEAVLQSHYHSPYTPGRGQLCFITFRFGTTPEAGGERGAGYYDGSNGVFLSQDSSGLHLTLASTTDSGDSTVDQANWNIDPLDGSGPSGLTLDPTRTQILVVQLQALYVGRVVVGFDVDGELVPIHQFLNANTNANPYIADASLPVRYWAKSTDTAGSIVTTPICASVISEGGEPLQDIPGRPFVATGSLADTAAGTLLVIRPKSQFNSIDQSALILPTGFDVGVTDAGCWVEIRRNATVTAGTFEDVDSLSTAEVSFAGITGTDPVVTAGTGTLIDRFYIAAANKTSSDKAGGLLGKTLLNYSHLLGAADSLSVIFNGGTTSTDVNASVKWKEVR